MTNNISIILVRPQLGENIGMAARAMLNFGFSDLRIVSPRDPWPNKQALSSSAHASSVIDKAVIYSNLAEAIADSHFVFATSARPRNLRIKCISSREIEQQDLGEKKLSIIFGPENSGLSNEDLTFCNSVISIPVNPQCPSINLASSVALICYEFSKFKSLEKINTDQNNAATSKDINNLTQILLGLLEQTHHFDIQDKIPKMKNNLKAVFNRVDNFSKQEVQSLIGVFKSLFSAKK